MAAEEKWRKGGGRTEGEGPSLPTTKSKSKNLKKGNAATPSLKDCANCGAVEGTVPGSPIHKPCSRCKIAYYCSVRCQKHHWKVGGHKKRCVALADRSVAKVEAAEAEAAKATKGRQAAAAAAAAAEEGSGDGEGEECAICLEDLDDPEFGPAQILDCTHRFHRACVEELRERGVQQACPMCRAKLPDSAEKMSDDACAIYFLIKRQVEQGEDGPWGPLSRRQQRQMDEVMRLWEAAAEQGLAEAQFNLALTYQQGEGVDVNFKKAVEWFEKAAEQGDAHAQCNLGIMYYDGHGVDVNYKKAVQWYEKAAEQGHVNAQKNLGLMYGEGYGVDVNYQKAVQWYEKAAEQGDAQAQYNVGVMYEFGPQGVDQSDSMAMRWYAKAAAQGDVDAQARIDGILVKRRASASAPGAFDAQGKSE